MSTIMIREHIETKPVTLSRGVCLRCGATADADTDSAARSAVKIRCTCTANRRVA